MVVIEFDLPRSVSLSALDENNVTLKDAPENGGPESNKMVPRATLICRPNSHPFQVKFCVFGLTSHLPWQEIDLCTGEEPYSR